MTILVRSNAFIASGSITAAKKYAFAITNFLRSASPNGPSWSISGSSNGVAGGMGSDLISDASDFIVDSWVVFEPPNSAFQILLSRVGESGDNNFHIAVNTSADYTGGSAGVDPTSPSSNSHINRTSHNIFDNSGQGVVHFIADTSAPYGLITYGHSWSLPTFSRSAFAVIPLDFENSGGYPYVFYLGGSNSAYLASSLADANTTSDLSCMSLSTDGTEFTTYRGSYLFASSGSDLFSVGAHFESNPVTTPILFGTPNERFGLKGSSQFVQMMYDDYRTPTYFDNLNKIVIRDVLVPWDGSTIFNPTPITWI